MASITPYPKARNQPCWRLSYRDPQTGKWRNKLLHCSRDRAEQIRKRIEAEFTWLAANPHLREDRQEAMLSDVVEIFMKAKAGTVAPRTADRYQDALDNLKDFAGEIRMEQVTRRLIDDYRARILKDRSAAGVNVDLRHIKAFLRFTQEEGYLKKVPKIEMAREVNKPVYWVTQKQYRDHFAKAPEVLGPDAQLVTDISDLLLLTAARANELITATWEQIDLESGFIQLYDDKGNTAGKLYLSDRAVQILGKYRENVDRPFHINYDWYERRLRKLPPVSKIKLSAHDLRKTAGAWMVQNGVDIFHVSRFMRHSSVTVTERFYADLLPQNHHNTAQRMAELFKEDPDERPTVD